MTYECTNNESIRQHFHQDGAISALSESNPGQPGYIFPKCPRTYIFREGTNEDKITGEIYRMDLGTATHNGPGNMDPTSTATHNGPGNMDPTIATDLYLASNPEMVKEMSCNWPVNQGLWAYYAALGHDFHGSKASQNK
jgi:hypothetical protein